MPPMVPADRFSQVKHREYGEHRDCDDFLDYFQLGAGINRVADAIGGNGKAILEEGDTQLTGMTIQSATPGKRSCPYQAKVMNTFEQSSSTIGRTYAQFISAPSGLKNPLAPNAGDKAAAA